MSDTPEQLENSSPTTAADLNSTKTKRAVIVRYPKAAIFFALLSLLISALVAYEVIFSQFGLVNKTHLTSVLNQQMQKVINNDNELKMKLAKLNQEVIDLNDKVLKLKDLKSKADNPDPIINLDNLIITSLNSYLNAANTSLLVFQDYATSLKLLTMAKELVSKTENPKFNEFKIALSQKISELIAINNEEKVFIVAKLGLAFKLSSELGLINPKKDPAESKEEAYGVFNKFISNVKASIKSIFQVSQTNNQVLDMTNTENKDLIKTHLNLELLNAKAAFINNNQSLWESSLLAAKTTVVQYYPTNNAKLNLVSVLNELLAIKLSSAVINLDSCINQLNKLNNDTLSN